MVDLSIVMLACLPEANLKNSHWKSHGETTQEDDLYDLSIPHMRTMVLEYESQHLPKKKIQLCWYIYAIWILLYWMIKMKCHASFRHFASPRLSFPPIGSRG